MVTEPMRLDTHVDGDATVVAARGEIDFSCVEELSRCLQGVARNRPLVVDLSLVTFFDSTVLNVLVAEHNVRSPLTSVALVVPERFLRIFDVTGLTDAFKICSTLRDAMDAVRDD